MPLPAFGTHQPLLFGVCLASSGPILELGSGFFSTPFIHALSVTQGRRCVTVDANPEYYNFMKPFQTAVHDVILLGDFSRTDAGKAVLPVGRTPEEYIGIQRNIMTALVNEHGNFGVVFVDHDPGFLRQPAVEFFRDHATYVVVHDVETPGHYGFDFSSYQFHFMDRSVGAWTVVLSNEQECGHFREFVPVQSFEDGVPDHCVTARFNEIEIAVNTVSWSGWTADLVRPTARSFIEIAFGDGGMLPDCVQVLVRLADSVQEYFWIVLRNDGKNYLRPDRNGNFFIQFAQMGMVGNRGIEKMSYIEVRARSTVPAVLKIEQVRIGTV